MFVYWLLCDGHEYFQDFDHGMERVLFSIQYAPRMKLTFQARAGSINHQHHQQQQQHHQAQMIVHHVVFPHTI